MSAAVFVVCLAACSSADDGEPLVDEEGALRTDPSADVEEQGSFSCGSKSCSTGEYCLVRVTYGRPADYALRCVARRPPLPASCHSTTHKTYTCRPVPERCADDVKCGCVAGPQDSCSGSEASGIKVTRRD